MKKIFLAFFTTLALLTQLAMPASALDRVQWIAGSNPPSPWMNQEERDSRIGIGQLIFDMAGSTNGFFHNISVVPVTGLFVSTGPTTVNTVGSLYQYLPEDVNAFGGFPSGTGALALPADNTKVFLQGTTLASGASIGPLSPPGTGGQSINYLVECQVQTIDNTPYTISLVNNAGTITQVGVNETRGDVITCQSKAGTAATTGSQTTPSVDTGFVGIGFVAVPNGTTTITSGMITGFQQFNGFGGFAASVALQSATPGTQQTGSSNVSGTAIAGTQAINGAGSFTSSSTNVVEKSTTGTTNVTFIDGGGVTLNRGALTLSGSPLGIGSGGTGVASMTAGGCLSYNGTTVVTVACSTSGGSGVSSATAPVVFSGGIMSCPTCVFTQSSLASEQANVGWAQGFVAGPGARHDTDGDLGTGNSTTQGRIWFGTGADIDYGITTAGAFTASSQLDATGALVSATQLIAPQINFTSSTASANIFPSSSSLAFRPFGSGGEYLFQDNAGTVNLGIIDGSGNFTAGGNVNAGAATGFTMPNTGAGCTTQMGSGGGAVSGITATAWYLYVPCIGQFAAVDDTGAVGWSGLISGANGIVTSSTNNGTRAYVAPMYAPNGANIGSTTHTVTGQVTTAGGSFGATVNLSGNAAFSNIGTYQVTATYNGTSTLGYFCTVTLVSGSQFLLTAINPGIGNVAGVVCGFSANGS